MPRGENCTPHCAVRKLSGNTAEGRWIRRACERHGISKWWWKASIFLIGRLLGLTSALSGYGTPLLRTGVPGCPRHLPPPAATTGIHKTPTRMVTGDRRAYTRPPPGWLQGIAVHTQDPHQDGYRGSQCIQRLSTGFYSYTRMSPG
jgi:hypothetical protein